MARILFISGDVGGNVPPTLAIAGELALRGHEVAVLGLSPRDSGSAELEWISLPSIASMDVRRPAGPLGHGPALARMALGRGVAREVRAVLRSREPGAVVVDGVMLGSIREAVRSGIPTAVLFHSLGAFWAKGMGNPVANALMRPAGLAPLELLRRVDARLLPTDSELDPAHAGGSPIAFDWVGTTELGAPHRSSPGGTQRVLVSLSSAWQRGQAEVYQRIMNALEPLPVEVVVTTGGAQLDAELAPTRNATVHGRVSHAEVMPTIDLVVGHGGHSTTMKALAHGIPMLVLPLDPTSDQPLIGRTIAAAGLGRTLPRNAEPEVIASAVSDILADEAIVEAVIRTGERLRAQHGAKVGAEKVEAILR